ncbi:uncharacterized protein LOC143672165 [Tamandua tetradactyla]|uniref:uncharacterized protein LOC143672165 n=1 Tax=Tamandua tetradactyla TaxID=48850 RepID=UPI004053CC0B
MRQVYCHLPRPWRWRRPDLRPNGIQCRQRGISPSLGFLNSLDGAPVTARAAMDAGQFLEPGFWEHRPSVCSFSPPGNRSPGVLPENQLASNLMESLLPGLQTQVYEEMQIWDFRIWNYNRS